MVRSLRLSSFELVQGPQMGGSRPNDAAFSVACFAVGQPQNSINLGSCSQVNGFLLQCIRCSRSCLEDGTGDLQKQDEFKIDGFDKEASPAEESGIAS